MNHLDHSFNHLLHDATPTSPPKSFQEKSNLTAEEWKKLFSLSPEEYWAQRSKHIDWFSPWETLLQWTPPTAKWFLKGRLNLAYNCLDRHLEKQADKTALIWESEPGEIRSISYKELHEEVCRLGNALKTLGVKRGDRVALYLPMMIEAVVSMLACARIGAIHSVVFGGFSPKSLQDRMEDSQCAYLITADALQRNGKKVPLKVPSDEATEKLDFFKASIVIPRFGKDVPMRPNKDFWYDELISSQSTECPAEEMDSEDPLFILYTSGTTGKPKGIVHTQGGYAVGAQTTTELVFDAKADDIFWCTADVGWITGHTYVTYGPLLNGMTQLLYEGGPLFPTPARFWEIIDRHKVTTLYTAPTAIRTFMRLGDSYPKQCSLASLRLLGSVGEPLNPEAWQWYSKHIGRNLCPIVDTWWQTETGSIMITDHPAHSQVKPGFAGKALPGVQCELYDETGSPLPKGSSSGGYIALTHPWPSMLRTIWGDHERYIKTYFSKWDTKSYFAGDGAYRDAAGRMMILGRVDDVLNVSGHRIGTMEVESSLVGHPAVAEAAVVGKPCAIKGESIAAFVTLKDTSESENKEQLEAMLIQHVSEDIGKIARPDLIIFTSELPKTRSGKIMRRLLRDLLVGKEGGDTTTLANPSGFDDLKQELQKVLTEKTSCS